MTIRIVDLPARDLRQWLRPALTVYVTAMNYPPGTETHRAPLWQEHVTRPGWRAVGAISTDQSGPGTILTEGPERARETLVGVAYGYRGALDQWWNQQLRTGMRICRYPHSQIDELLSNYFELTELHVHPSAQGAGVGAALLTHLLEGRSESRVLLSTPEVDGEANRAWSLYRRFGFTDVLRRFMFTGDPRPFAVLGRTLPLTEPPGSAHPQPTSPAYNS